MTPSSTVRLQLHADFGFDAAREQVPYYARLGVSHFYLSPVTRARPGSRHGYDVVDHTRVSDALGGEEGLIALAECLHEQGMGLILDIVPNHMAVHADNAWWWSVLESGVNSPCSAWFDIDWRAADPRLRGKVLAPFLARPYAESLANGDIRLVHDDGAGAWRIEACGNPYPIAPGTMPALGLDPAQSQKLFSGRHADGRQRLHDLLERQHYRLAWWRCAADSINWRRFFDITELIGVRVELEEVFDAVHALPLRLYEDGWIDGLRIDHVDGLADPLGYCRRLRAALDERALRRPAKPGAGRAWIVVEKILAPSEILDSDWQADGTTGYDFMDQAGAVLHDPTGESALTATWNAVAQDAREVGDYVREARALLLRRYFVAERKALLEALHEVAQRGLQGRDWSIEAIGRVLDELLLGFPVYRSYADGSGRRQADADLFKRLLPGVSERLQLGRYEGEPLLACLDGWLGGEPCLGAAIPDAPGGDARKTVLNRFQQLTPPLAAKSLEDTVFYRYGRLLSRNEVGSDPAVFSLSVDDFHQQNAWRARYGNMSMLATATHDHKRGEDVRARLAVLSEIPLRWGRKARGWLRDAEHEYPAAGPRQAGERYMLFQTLVGAWPLDLAPDAAPADTQAYLDRVAAWQLKALREAKRDSSWMAPDPGYEARAADFIGSLAAGGANRALLAEIGEFAHDVAAAGAVNSLAQLMLSVMSPGVPDLYQGTELWDFSLVDPDNRRPVAHDLRGRMLRELEGKDHAALLRDWRSGAIKQAVLARSLAVRRGMLELFRKGDYVPLRVDGPRTGHVLAFMRVLGDQHAVVVAPRLCAQAIGIGAAAPMLPATYWRGTRLALPSRYAGAAFTDALTGARHAGAADGMLDVTGLLAGLPVALLVEA
ncbi:MAG: malto-oligosyltrehalose synthase [Alcaligenaceae bacterium]|nr:malto-oligosyltrehalose synthase [Alcaligenaceae bacterium]